MILYTLQCKNGHSFDSWFASSNTFDKLKKIGELKCEICGCIDVEKQLMAPKLNSNHKNRVPVEKNMLTKAHSEAEKIFKEFKKKIEKNTENVGRDFAKIAREIHAGESPERSIIGEATPKETLELIEDDIPVTPLPWLNRKSN